MSVQNKRETWGALIHHYIASDAPRRPPIFDGRDYGRVAPSMARRTPRRRRTRVRRTSCTSRRARVTNHPQNRRDSCATPRVGTAREARPQRARVARGRAVSRTTVRARHALASAGATPALRMSSLFAPSARRHASRVRPSHSAVMKCPPVHACRTVGRALSNSAPHALFRARCRPSASVASTATKAPLAPASVAARITAFTSASVC